MDNSASINLVFNSFLANANGIPASGAPGGNYCTVKSLQMVDDANGQVSLSGTTIQVQQNNPGNQPIHIALNVSCAGDPTNYNPLAIVFVGPVDPDGSNNFPKTDRNPNDQTIKFKDHCRHKNSTRWKYYIQITQTSSGQVGWIDPDVQNDN